MSLSSPLRVAATLLVALVCCNAAHADPEVGWWWNPDESGRGFFIESQGGIVFLAGYFYESDGRATWLVSGGSNSDPYSYQGRLLRVTGGQTLFGDYRPPDAPTDAGPISLRFTDDQHGTLTWPGGTIAIERDYFGTPGNTPRFEPQSGWWWNAAENGRGYSIEVQGNNLFAVAFMYDDAGNPVWYWSAGPMSTPMHYEGQWLQFANGQTMGGAYRPPSAPTPVGRLSIDFTTVGDAVVTSDDSVAVLTRDAAGRNAARRSRTTRITREFNYPRPYELPSSFVGTFAVELILRQVDDGESAKDTINITSDLMFERDIDNLLEYLFPGEVSADYSLVRPLPGSTIHVNWTHESRDEFGTCTGTYDRDLGFPAGGGGFVAVGSYSGGYSGSVSLGPIALAQTVTCKSLLGGNEETKSVLIVVPLAFGMQGSVRDNYIKRTYRGEIVNSESTLKAEYSLRGYR